MGKAPCCDKANVKRGPWSPDEDHKLKEFIQKHGTGGNWIALPHKAGLKRCGKSCRLRWLNYLRPNINHGEFSEDEDRVIFSLFATIGSRWSIIASQLPGRTDNDIKNHWNTKLKKRLLSSCSLSRKKTPLFQQQSLEKQQQQQSFSLSPLQLNYHTTASSPYQKPLMPPCFSPQVEASIPISSESFSPPSSSSSLMQNPYRPADKDNGNHSNIFLYNGHRHSCCTQQNSHNLCTGDYSIHGNVYGSLQEFGGGGFQSAEMGECSSVYSCEGNKQQLLLNNNSLMQLRYSLQDQTVVKTVILYELSS